MLLKKNPHTFSLISVMFSYISFFFPASDVLIIPERTFLTLIMGTAVMQQEHAAGLKSVNEIKLWPADSCLL